MLLFKKQKVFGIFKCSGKREINDCMKTFLSTCTLLFLSISLHSCSNETFYDDQIIVSDKKLIVSHDGKPTILKLSGDFERDQDSLLKWSSQLVVPQYIQDSQKKNKEYNQLFKYKIIPKSDSILYSVYAADILSKLSYCRGSIIYNPEKSDSILSLCLRINPSVGIEINSDSALSLNFSSATRVSEFIRNYKQVLTKLENEELNRNNGKLGFDLLKMIQWKVSAP